MKEIETEILIVGGGLGGCAAAIAAASAGSSVVMTEESDWIGGQLTSQATPPDEHGWIEQFGCTAAYRKMRENVRAYYRRFYPLTEAAMNNKYLNPGNGWVSPLCAEPEVFLNVLLEMMRKFIKNGQIRLLMLHFPVAAAFAYRLWTCGPSDRLDGTRWDCRAE